MFNLVNYKILFLLFYYRLLNLFFDLFDYLSEFIRCVFVKVLNYFNIIMGGYFNFGDIDWDIDVLILNNFFMVF